MYSGVRLQWQGYQFPISMRALSIYVILSFYREAHLPPVPLLILSDLLGCVCAMASIHLCLTSPGPRVHLPPHVPTGAY